MRRLFLLIHIVFLSLTIPARPGEAAIQGQARPTGWILVLESPSLRQRLAQWRQARLAEATIATNLEQARQRNRAERDTLIRDLQAAGNFGEPTQVRHFEQLIHAIAVPASQAQISRFQRHPLVAGVFPDHRLSVPMDAVSPADAKTPQTSPSPAGKRTGAGTGMRIGILDSGIDHTHPDLGGGFGEGFKVAGGWDFVNGDADPFDDVGHGTLVAGIAAADGVVQGVAPGALLIAYKVAGADGSASTSATIAALERAMDPDENPLTDDHLDIVNLSLSGDGGPNEPLAQAIDMAESAGICVITAAGNSGRYANIKGPAAARAAITVGAANGDSEVANFSTRGPVRDPGAPEVIKPNLIAPGTAIVTTRLGGGHGKASGTSMAAPHVAGAAALLREAHPNWTPARIKASLMNHAIDLEENLFAQGAGSIDLDSAMEPFALLEPAELYLGRVNLHRTPWQYTTLLTLTNPGSEPQDYELQIGADLPEGIHLEIVPNQLTLAANESREVQLLCRVDTANPPAPDLLARGHEGRIEVHSQDRVLSHPWLLSRTVMLSPRFDKPLSRLQIFDDEGTFARDWIATEDDPLPEDFAFEVPPTPIHMIAWLHGDDTTGAYLLVHEHALFDLDDAPSFKSATAEHRLDLSLLDHAGMPLAWPSAAQRDVLIRLRHEPTQTLFAIQHQKIPTLATNQISSQFSIDQVAIAEFAWDPHTYVARAGQTGVTASSTETADARDFKSITFSLDQADLPGGTVLFPDLQVAGIGQQFMSQNTLQPTRDATGHPLRHALLLSPDDEHESPQYLRWVWYRGNSSVQPDFENPVAQSTWFGANDSERLVLYPQLSQLNRNASGQDLTETGRIRVSQGLNYFNPTFAISDAQVRIQSPVTNTLSPMLIADAWHGGSQRALVYQIVDSSGIPRSGTFTSTKALDIEPGPVQLELSYRGWQADTTWSGSVVVDVDSTRKDADPPRFTALRLELDGRRVEDPTPGTELVFDVADESGVGTVTVDWRPNQAPEWIALAPEVSDGTYRVALPEPEGSQPFTDLRIAATDALGNRQEQRMTRALAWRREVSLADSRLYDHLLALHDDNEDGSLSLEEARRIETISARGLGLESLEGIHYLENLTDLDVAANALTELPETLASLPLSDLDLSDNQLSEVEVVTRIATIRSLRLEGNLLGPNDCPSIERLRGHAALDLTVEPQTDVAQIACDCMPRIVDQSLRVEGCSGDAVSLAVAAESCPEQGLVYQWWFEDQRVQGANDAELVLNDFDSGQAGYYRVEVGGSQGVIASAWIEVAAVAVETGVAAETVLAAGSEPTMLTAEFSCAADELVWHWRNLEDQSIFGAQANPVVLEPRPNATAHYRLEVSHPSTGHEATHDITVLVPADPERWPDPNDDGRADIADHAVLRPVWSETGHGSDLDVDGDGFVRVTDFLYFLSDTP
ncbi:S8 family serine peptidase [Sulfidibacter corallicola]|uniref:S8 family serine peptidase n=1 Tax=Sulfidibacter corallicola TaxID=2818388 RepID=A0A8A4TTH2_SULCO|nr:S8 family serine peptidase [Sulfidibacter corallicola]QTD52342.1 S8 family serine peptidase [Sulfidibacter corallicola]